MNKQRTWKQYRAIDIAYAEWYLRIHIYLMIITIALIVLLPVYSKLIRKIKTSIEVEDNGEMARKYGLPADHHTIRNCLMDFGHGALTLGSELAGGIRNLTMTQCLFHATDRGLRIKSRRGRGKDSIITNVLFDNIRMDGVLTPIVINMWYNCCDPDRYTEYVWSREHLPVDDRTPHMGTFCFRNMVCTDAEAAACYIDGLPESPIDKVVLENISVTFAKDAKPHTPAMQNFAKERCRLGFYLDNVKEIEIRNVSMKGQDGEMLVADHYEKITTEEFEQV